MPLVSPEPNQGLSLVHKSVHIVVEHANLDEGRQPQGLQTKKAMSWASIGTARVQLSTTRCGNEQHEHRQKA